MCFALQNLSPPTAAPPHRPAVRDTNFHCLVTPGSAGKNQYRLLSNMFSSSNCSVLIISPVLPHFCSFISSLILYQCFRMYLCRPSRVSVDIQTWCLPGHSIGLFVSQTFFCDCQCTPGVLYNPVGNSSYLKMTAPCPWNP